MCQPVQDGAKRSHPRVGQVSLRLFGPAKMRNIFFNKCFFVTFRFKMAVAFVVQLVLGDASRKPIRVTGAGHVVDGALPVRGTQQAGLLAIALAQD